MARCELENEIASYICLVRGSWCEEGGVCNIESIPDGGSRPCILVVC